MDSSIDLDDVIEAFVGTLLAGLVIVFVALPLARHFGFKWR